MDDAPAYSSHVLTCASGFLFPIIELRTPERAAAMMADDRGCAAHQETETELLKDRCQRGWFVLAIRIMEVLSSSFGIAFISSLSVFGASSKSTEESGVGLCASTEDAHNERTTVPTLMALVEILR